MRKIPWREFIPRRSGTGQVSAANDPRQAATELESLTRLDPDQAKRLEIFGAEAEAVAEYIRSFRHGLTLNLLWFRADGDGSVLATLVAFYDLAFVARRLASSTADPVEMIERAEAALLRLPGRDHFRSLAARDVSFASNAPDLLGASATSSAVGAYLSRAFGTLVVSNSTNFDETGYLAANPDVADAVRSGRVRSGWRHFLAAGEKEARKQRALGGEHVSLPAITYPLRTERIACSNFPVGAETRGAALPLSRLVDPAADEDIAFSVLSAAADYDAAHALAIETGDLSSSPSGRTPRTWRAEAVYVAAFKDGRADVAHGVAMYGADRIWGDSATPTLLAPRPPQRSRDLFALDGEFARLETGCVEVEGPLALASTWASVGNYGHWLMNSLFAAYLLQDVVRAGQARLLFPKLPPAFRDSLTAIGIPECGMFETSHRHVRTPLLLYPSPLSTSANTAPGPLTRPYLDFLRTRLPRQNSPSPEFVFVARGDHPSGRRMSNEDELAEALARLGFVRVLPQDYPIAGQIHLLANARIVVGQFGAALWNTAFMPQGSLLIEIATTNYVSDEYLRVACLTGHRLARVMIDPGEVARDAYAGFPFEFRAPVERIVALVRDAMSAL